MKPFEPRVIAVLRAIPAGEVMTYGEVAAEAGFPGAARAVGNLLRTSDEDLPWWGVVDARGRLVPGHEREHTKRLLAEGVNVLDGRVRRAPRPTGSATPRPPTGRTRGR